MYLGWLTAHRTHDVGIFLTWWAFFLVDFFPLKSPEHRPWNAKVSNRQLERGNSVPLKQTCSSQWSLKLTDSCTCPNTSKEDRENSARAWPQERVQKHHHYPEMLEGTQVPTLCVSELWLPSTPAAHGIPWLKYIYTSQLSLFMSQDILRRSILASCFEERRYRHSRPKLTLVGGALEVPFSFLWAHWTHSILSHWSLRRWLSCAGRDTHPWGCLTVV